jgi:hypothetical protein
MSTTEELTERLAVLNTYPISQWAYPRVLVGILLERAISHADKVFWPFMHLAIYGPAFSEQHPGRIDYVRNKMVIDLLQSDYTHLLMLDIDHIHPPDIVQRLARWPLIDPKVRVVSGINFRRGKPFDPVFGNYNGHKKRMTTAEWDLGLIQADEVGGATLLVHRSVFEEMEPPWFFNVYDKVWENDWPGEDIGFCRKCQALDIPIYIDTTTTSPHCTDGVITEQTFRDYMQAHPQEFRDP